MEQLQDYALVVGINKYANGDFLETLYGPCNDANNFVKWLFSEPGGQLPKEHVTPFTLLSDDVGQKPKTGDVIEAIKSLLALAPPEKPIGRRLYIFMAGHGVGPDLDDTGLLTAEATEDAPSYIEGRRYANLFRGRGVFEEIVLMMDCCRDYDGTLPAPVFPFKPRLVPGIKPPKYFYAYATGFGRDSREKEIDAQVSGIFSHAVIAGLNGGAVDGDGRITGQSLERFIIKTVKTLLPAGVNQLPEIRTDSEMVFAEGFKPRTGVVRIAATIPHAGVLILLGVGFQAVAAEITTVQPNVYEVNLPIGKVYVFQLVDAAGAILKQTGQTLDDAEGVVDVKL